MTPDLKMFYKFRYKSEYNIIGSVIITASDDEMAILNFEKTYPHLVWIEFSKSFYEIT